MKEVRTLRMVEKQQAESELIFNRTAKMALDNIGILSKAILNKSGMKAYICEGLTVTKESAFVVRVKAGTAILRSEGGDNIIGVMPQDSLVTIPAASGIVRRDIIELYLEVDNTQTDIIKRVLSETGTITTVTSDREQTYLLKAKAISPGGDALSTAGSRAMVRSNPLSATLDLSSRYIITVRDGEYGQKVQVDCRGATPEATTLAEICARINTIIGRSAVSVYDGNRIQFEGKSAGFQDYFELHPPVTETEKDATNIIFSLPIVGLYIHKFSGNNGGFKICEYVVTETATEITDLYDFKNKAYWEQESTTIDSGDFEHTDIEYCLPPIGSCMAYAPGYCTIDGTFIPVSVELSNRFEYLDGTLYQNPNSPFYGEGHYKPNWTDNVFLMGSNLTGLRGGQNSYNLTTSQLPPHLHSITHDHGTHAHTGSTGYVSADHAHGIGDPTHAHVVPGGAESTDYAAGSNRTGSRGGATSYGAGTGIWTGGISANHYHSFTTNATGVSLTTGSSGNGDFENIAIENRPIYFSTPFIQRVA